MLFGPIQHHNTIRLLGLIVVTWLAQAWACDRALASCGDYVTVGHGRRMNQAEHPSPGDSRGLPTCFGPNCQRQVPLPMAPEHLVLSGPHDSACSLAAATARQRDDYSMRVDEPALLASQAAPLPPDPPPRAVARA